LAKGKISLMGYVLLEIHLRKTLAQRRWIGDSRYPRKILKYWGQIISENMIVECAPGDGMRLGKRDTQDQ
jgi:hypothetical protein